MRSNNTAYIYSALRTPIGAFNGALAPVSAPDLTAMIIPESLKSAGLQPEDIDEVLLGNVVSAGLGQAPARQAALRGGLPSSVPATTVNKICGSGMKAVMMADQAIRLNQARFIVAGGMESMSRAPFLLPQMRKGRKLGNTEMVDSLIHDGLWDSMEKSHMGGLCERVAQNHCVSRESQDLYALSSYKRAQKAQENGFFSNEIVEIPVKIKGGSKVINQDESPRTDDLNKLPFLSPAFDKNGGTITQGNGAKIADGAAILVVGEGSSSLKPIARIVGYATHAESPSHFALAPIEAIKTVLKLCHLNIADIDLFEINEAFAAASIIVNELLELDAEKVNIHGGSIALGHPIGATGARILVTLINGLRTKGLQRGLASLCIGGGEATAMVVEIV